MHIIGKERFVIEISLPVGKFENKTIIDDNLGPVTVPDGERQYEYNWFVGIAPEPNALNHPDPSKRKIIPMNVWSPHPDEATRYKHKDEAEFVLNAIMGGVSGGYVVSVKESHLLEGRKTKVLIPGKSFIKKKI